MSDLLSPQEREILDSLSDPRTTQIGVKRGLLETLIAERKENARLRAEVEALTSEVHRLNAKLAAKDAALDELLSLTPGAFPVEESRAREARNLTAKKPN